jgi:hypothetical protein
MIISKDNKLYFKLSEKEDWLKISHK